MAVSDWSTTASANTVIGAVGIAENCDAANINNAIREVMAQSKTKFNSLDAAIVDVLAYESNAALNAIAALTPVADGLPYFTSGSAAGLATVTSFMRTVLDDADAAAACLTLGAIRVIASSFTTPGYVKFAVGASVFMVAWGTFTIGADSGATVAYAAAFPTAGFPVLGGPNANYGDITPTENGPGITANSTTGFTAWNGQNNTRNMWYIAVGY